MPEGPDAPRSNRCPISFGRLQVVIEVAFGANPTANMKDMGGNDLGVEFDVIS